MLAGGGQCAPALFGDISWQLFCIPVRKPLMVRSGSPPKPLLLKQTVVITVGLTVICSWLRKATKWML